ncbi:MAG TPA: biopolymer transporter ExbD [Longimicrobiaceae bacterium]|nr:biopolymer transporter ExbD [Longimicrobiaceae bacterium]
MAMGVGGKKGGAMNEINMTPMIDVLLVLLIIFMVVQQGLQRGVSVQVPPVKKEKQEVAQNVDQIVLDIRPGPEYFLNQEPIQPTALEERLREVFAPRPRKVIFVKGAENLTYGQVIYAVDATRAAGVEVVGLVPRPDAAPAPTT